MMDKKKSLSLVRQEELIRINRVLATLVVVLAFLSGLLLALREEWLTSKTVKAPLMPETTVATISGYLSVPTPAPKPLFQLLRSARYDRVLESTPLSKISLFQILWAAQGRITNWGERTVPSYKSAYPVSLLVFVRKIDELPSGWYRFNAGTQQLEPLATMPLTLTFPSDVPGLGLAPLLIVASVPEGMETDYLTWNEAGGIAQNILLAVANEQLGTFLLPTTSLPDGFRQHLKLSKETLLWLMPVGHTKLQETNSKE